MPSRYYADSRAPRYSILFAAPLLAAYEVLAWGLARPAAPGVRNGADVILKSLFIRVGGADGVLVFEALLLITGGFLVARDWRRHPGPLRAGVFPLMALESLGLAIVVGLLLRYATAAVLHTFALSNPAGLDTGTQLMISLGAGIYEELLFRVLVVGALLYLAKRVLKWQARPAGILAVIVSALLFSAFHYVGAYGDTLRLSSFVFRFLAGVVFSTLYVLRGFGITAWTHALYDVIVTLSG